MMEAPPGCRWQPGPAKVVFLRPCAGVGAVVVIDNVALGPAIGGVRVRPDVTVGEVARLARAMTVKNAVAGLPHGGGKAGIAALPRLAPTGHERMMRAFARAIEQLTDYIPGPDMGTSETSMGYVYDEIGRAVGLPAVLGGIPLNELGATGFGVAVCAEVVSEAKVFGMAGGRVVIQGFGAVGSNEKPAPSVTVVRQSSPSPTSEGRRVESGRARCRGDDGWQTRPRGRSPALTAVRRCHEMTSWAWTARLLFPRRSPT